MLSMLRSNLYRLVHSTLFWSYLGIYAVLGVLLALLCWVVTSGDVFGTTQASELFGGPSVSSFVIYGQSCMASGLVVIFVAALSEVFFARDFDSGYVKNLVQIKGGRPSYAVATTLTSLAVAVLFILVGVVVAELAFRAFGFGPLIVFPPVAEVLLWMAQVVLVTLAYVQIVLFVVFLTHSNTLGLVVVFVVASGMLESILSMVFSNVFKDVPALRDSMDNYLAAAVTALQSGPVEGAHVYVIAGATIAVALVAAIVAMCRRDVK